MFYTYTIKYMNKKTGQICELSKPFTTWTELATTGRIFTRNKCYILTIKFNNYKTPAGQD